MIFFYPSPEKALLECAFELRSDLDSAASDVSGLFAKIGGFPFC